ncbi:MAG: serine hydrolase, partial [Candidatus Brocadiae bacterium]|nr:serine hydrolase [Candidatus Brocadiia bacterium]
MAKWLTAILAVGAAAMTCDAAQLQGAVFPGRAWVETTPESQGLDPAKLKAAIAYLNEHTGRDGVRELVIVRHGRIVWKGDRIDKVHGVWSLTKSFTSTCLGLLIDDGKCTLDTKAGKHVPDLAAGHLDVTLRHFATMTSGYRAIGDEPRGGYTHGPSRTPFKPGKPLFAPPGSQYAYWDSAMNEFGHVLTRIAGEPLEALLKRRIADPIGMNPKAWRWGRLGKVDGLTVNGGSGNGNGHVFVSARELARFGLLFLHRGSWGGKQLIAADWVNAATRVHVPASMPLAHPESKIDGRGVYGLNWWRNGLGADGKRKWPGAPSSAFAASGFNNNDLFVVPEWQMVVVRLGLDENERKITDEVYGEFLRQIGAAIIAPDLRPASGPLRVHPKNPRWFADKTGRAVWLTGSHTWANRQERGVEGQTPDFDYTRHLDFLATHGHNFLRLWAWEHAQWMQFVPATTPVRYSPNPWARTGPGPALDGKPKFDLTKLDDAYFARLRQRVVAARDRGIYVAVMLFQGFSLAKNGGDQKKGNAWHGHPFHRDNNINGIDGNPSRDDTGNEVHTLKLPAVVRCQEAYVRKTLDAVGDLDNVLWEIGNECHRGSVKWQHHMIRFIRKVEAERPKQHLIGMTGAPIGTKELLASPADWISPPGRQWLTGPPAADGRKIVVVDTDHCQPWGHDPSWPWKCLLRGHHFILMDHYMDFRIGSPKRPDPKWD